MAEEFFVLDDKQLASLSAPQIVEEYKKLRGEYTHLETAFDSLEQDLQELETERAASKGGKSGKKGAKPTGDINEDEITRLNDRLAEQDALIADKQDKITELSQTVKAFKQELAEAKNIERKQSDTIATLQKEIASKSNEGQQSRTQVNDIKRKLLEASEDSRRLHDENTRLQDTVENLEKACQLLSDQNDKMTLHISDLTDKHDNLQEHKDVHETRQEELEVQLKEMTERLEKTQEELLAAQDDGEWLAQIEILKKSLKQSQDKAAGDAKTAKTEIAALQEKVKSLSNDTLIGKKVKELEAQQAALKENLQLIDEMAKQLAAAEKNRSEAVDSLRRVEESIEQRVAERVLAEREKNRNLERTLAGLMTRTTDEADKYKSLEKENVDLHRQVDDLSNWKNIYENGHGMQGLARDQKKLKDDNRRMQVAMEQLTAKLGAVLDANGMLVHSFDKLKIECGKPPSFAYPEYQLSDDMKTENARLQSQMNEVEDQLGAIEQENTRLRKALKAQAGSVGEQGFKFAGLNADQLVKVNEFAGNLRDGKVELPVDDRSAKLLKENKRLREEREELQMKIQGFERQLLGGAGLSSATRAAGGGVAALDREQEAELMGLRDDMRKMLTENADLKDRMAAMQNEVLVLLKASVGKSDNRTEELEALLLSQNEKLTRQLNELKAQQMSGMQITSQQIEQHQQQVAAAAAAKAEADKRAGKHSQKPTPAVQSKQPQPLKVPPRQSAETPAPSGHPTQTATAAAGGAVAQYAHTPVVGTEGMGGSFYAAPPTHSYAGPGTPHGKALLGKTLTQLNLPPEEWAEEVKDINGQLVECLEQLFERERELEESQTVVSGLEDNLVAIKQQLAAIYYDFAQRSEAWESREKEIKAANLALHNERDDLALKVKRMQEMIAVTRSEDPKTIEDKLMEVSRKLTVYEVNESILARKYTSQAEQLASEQQTRERLEDNFVEMESLLKKRILYLEQYKLAAGSRLGHLQGKVDSSVPQGDYLELQAELECLREEHLKALRREVDARVAALKAKDQASELRALRVNMAHMDASLSAARSSAFNLSGQLEHQKEYTSRALAAAGQKSSSELSSIISEMAKYRGETGRLEVELAAATRRAEALTEQMTLVSDEAAQAQKTLAELELREEEASAKESAMRKTCLDMELAYQGGLTREAADALRQKLEKISQSLEESNREVARNKELAEIASLQAQTMGNFRAAHDEELRELREHCMRLESRSDDDILIGKLQRQLMATRSAYKAFVNKYQHLRGNMRQRELAVRTLETRLDQREETVIKMQEAHRLQVQALKTALRSVQNVTEDDTVKVSDGKDKSPRKGRAGVKFVTIGSKLMQMSSRVNSLAELAEQAMKKAAVAESENLTMEGMLQDLQAEKELLATQARDLEALYKGGKGKQQAVASRLVSLSEEVRVNKLACLQQRRQIQVLRAEKKHLQHVIAGFECDMETLEESKVAAETKHLLGALPGGEGKSKHLGSVDSEVAVDLSLEDFPRMAPSTAESQSRGSLNKPKIVIDVDDDGAGIGGSSDAELLEKIEAMSTQLATASKESSGLRLAADRFKDQVVFLQQALQEKDGQVQYYERVARQEGLPLIGSGATLPHVHGGGEGGANSRQLKQMKDEHAKMQEAAAATITSLKSLVDEKTRLIEQYRRKVEDLGGEKRTKSRADKRADELLQRLNETEGRSGSPSKAARGRGGQLGNLDDGDLPAAHRQLIEQLESADVMLQEKDRVAGQLEQKLAQQTNMRERAEVRCGSAIKEMDSMKADMVTLAQQLQMSEERLRRMTGRPVGGADPGDKRVVELQKAVKAKDEKVRGYREIIVRLKEEFIKAEEEKAIAAVSAAAATGGKAGGPKGAGVDAAGASGGLGADDIKDLRNQIGALRDGLRQAKEDLENARKTREKLVSARGAAQEENERLEAAVGRAEAQAASASESLHRCRKDLEESRRKEGRLRDRLKELLEAEGGSDKVKDLRAATDRLKELERELEVAKAQNLALRRAAEDGAGSTFAATAGVGSPSPLRGTAAGGGTSSTGVGATGRASAGPSGSAAAAAGSGRAPPGHFPNGPGGDAAGHLLGVGEGNQDELRNQLHTKWENEKKLQKRIVVVEKRLQDKLDENEELQGQLKRARDALTQANSAKDDALKRAAAAGKGGAAGVGAATGGPGHAGKPSMDEVMAAENASARIFQLEEQLSAMRRKAEVEQANEIASMRHRMAVLQAKVGELEVDLEEANDRRKKAQAAGGAGAGQGRSLRESEDRFLREERLKDELEIARRQKLELEAALLDRDARAIEHRFDLESKEVEVDRLKKRVRELEAAYRAAAAASGLGGTAGAGAGKYSSAGSGSGTAGGGAAGAQRERDLEGVIEAMKRVVDKLKAENDRLKKGGGGDATKAAEADKRVAAEKKRADKAEEELKGMAAKLKGHEESSQKLMQKQDQVTKLRKQLKAREDELSALQADGSANSDEVNSLRRKLQTQDSRIQQLESSLQQAEAKASRAASASVPAAGTGAAAGGRGDREAENLRKRLAETEAEAEALKGDLAAAQRRLSEQGSGAGAGGAHPAALQAELRQLREENKNLRQELSAFDLDFFEEIEDLKNAHSEATRKLKQYESGGSSGGGPRGRF